MLELCSSAQSEDTGDERCGRSGRQSAPERGRQVDDARRTRPGARDQQGVCRAPCSAAQMAATGGADNQGHVRVLVPVDALSDEANIRRTDRADIQPDMGRMINILEVAIAASGERAQADAAIIEALASDLAAERGRADRAEQ
jgi:hypothetical protein